MKINAVITSSVEMQGIASVYRETKVQDSEE